MSFGKGLKENAFLEAMFQNSLNAQSTTHRQSMR
jgi:hypothetical protein